MIVKSLRATHIVILIFILFGWALPVGGWLWFHAALVPGIVIQWWLNKGGCLLTDLEHFLVRKFSLAQETNMNATTDGENESDEEFVRWIFRKIFDWNPSNKQLYFIIYGVVTSAWAATLWRLSPSLN